MLESVCPPQPEIKLNVATTDEKVSLIMTDEGNAARLDGATGRGFVNIVGETKPRTVDVQIVAATNEDLDAGKFRRDLLARLNTQTVVLPPLRERASDLPWMIREMVARDAAARGLAALPAMPDLVEACMLQAWPENGRGLWTVIARGVAVARAAGAQALGAGHCQGVREGTAKERRAETRAALKAAYERTGSKRKAAVEAGVKRSTAADWLKGKKSGHHPLQQRSPSVAIRSA